jgi:hypothetical protein
MRRTRARSPTRYGWWLLALLLTISAACGGAEPATQPTNVQPATVQVEVYFTNDTLGDPCTDVFGVTRTIDRDDILTGTLNALLAGPTPTEIDDGYGGWFGPTTADALLDATVDDDGTAHVTFTDLRELIPNASTSCGSTALLAMLDTTLLALDGITGTRYALADQTAFYAWLQRDDPDAPAAEEVTEPQQPTEPPEATDPGGGANSSVLTVELIAAELEAEWETNTLYPREATLSCAVTGSVEVGDVFVCELISEPEEPTGELGAVVVVVLDETTIAYSMASDNPGSTAQLFALYESHPHGLRCEDLLTDLSSFPFSGVGTTPETAYFWSVVYWNLEGQPARMDADSDGIPCETLYDPAVVSSVLTEMTP